jgi:hypothetical protein
MNTEYFKAIIFMKIGYHCDESLEEIIKRKKREESVSGKIFWGYSGSLCHPLTQVRPFIIEALKRKLKPLVLLSPTPSKYISQPKLMREYSIDRKEWYPLPLGVSIRGECRYALICKNLRRVNMLIDLNMYKVATGKNKGKPLGEVIKFRVDKACAFFEHTRTGLSKAKNIEILYIAEITEPFAVFLR